MILIDLCISLSSYLYNSPLMSVRLRKKMKENWPIVNHYLIIHEVYGLCQREIKNV